MAKAVEVPKNPLARAIAFTQEAWEELKKVHAPNRPETIQATLVVLAMTILIAGFLGLADLVVGKIMQAVLT